MKRTWFNCIEELCIIGLAPSGDDIDILKLKRGRGTSDELNYLRFLWGIIKKLTVGRPLTPREAQSFTRDLYEHQISYAGAWAPGEKVEIDCAWLRTNRAYVKSVMKHINSRFAALLRSGKQAANRSGSGRQAVGNKPANGQQHRNNHRKTLEDQPRDKDLDKDKELDIESTATSSPAEFPFQFEASPEFVPSARSMLSASPIREKDEEPNHETMSTSLREATDQGLGEQLPAPRRRSAKLGGKAVPKAPVAASEIEIAALPDRMAVAVFKNDKNHRVKIEAGDEVFYAGKFTSLFGWDNQVLPNDSSARDNAFYQRVAKNFWSRKDDAIFCHLLDIRNRRHPNTVVALDIESREIVIIVDEEVWIGGLEPVKSTNPKAPLLRGTLVNE